MSVVSIRGGIVPQNAVPRADVIKELEEALEMARSGEIQGIALASLHSDGLTSSVVCGAPSYALLGSVGVVMAGITDNLRSR